MINYVIQNIKKNVRKFIVMFLMLTICSTVMLFTLEVISNLILELGVRSEDLVAKEDLESMIFMLECGISLMIMFVAVIVHNTYSVLLFGREKEFNLLNRLGYHKKKIKKMLIGEIFVITCVTYVIGIAISKILSLTCMKQIDLMVVEPLGWDKYLICFIGMLIGMLIIINRNFKKVSIGYEQKKHIEVVDDKKIKTNIVWMVIGLVLFAILQFFPDEIYKQYCGNQAIIVKNTGCIVAIAIGIDGIIVIALKVLLILAERYHKNSIYIAVKQNMFNLKKVKSIISSIVLAVVFFVGFKGLYNSIEETTRKYVNESVNYEYLVLFEEMPMMTQDSLIELLEELKEEKGQYCICTTITLRDEKEKHLTITGIDENYYAMQRFYLTDGSDINAIYNETDELQVMFSSKKVAEKDWTIGTGVTDYKDDKDVFEFQIAATYDPINLNQAFASKAALSKRMYGSEDSYNTIYLNDFSEDAVEVLKQKFASEKFEIYDMKAFCEQCVEQATNGTEMIEILLYVSMFFVTSLVINLFVLSYGDRKRQYEEMSILGVKKTTLLKSVLVESGLIYVIGVLVGFVIAIPCIKIALEMVKEALVFETVMAIPYGLFLGIVGICFVIILVFTYLIGVSSVNMESTNRTNKE